MLQMEEEQEEVEDDEERTLDHMKTRSARGIDGGGGIPVVFNESGTKTASPDRQKAACSSTTTTTTKLNYEVSYSHYRTV